MKEVRDKLREFNQERDWDQFHSPENLAKSIVIEAAELLECFQWDDGYNKDDVCEELADVMNYCIMLADKLGVDPKEQIMKKIVRNGEKYPVDKAKGSSKKYNQFD